MIEQRVIDKYLVDGWFQYHFDSDVQLFRRWECITLWSEVVDRCEHGVEIHWLNRDVVLRITKQDCIKNVIRPLAGDPPKFHGMKFYYVPLRYCTYVSGDELWRSKLVTDYGFRNAKQIKLTAPQAHNEEKREC